MNTLVRWSLFGVIAFIISLALTVPAKQGLAWLPLGDEVNLHGVSGRLLEGHAQHLIIYNISINQLDWSWRPLALFLGHLSLDWTVNDPDITGEGSGLFPFVGQNEISNATASLSLAKLQTLLPTGTTVAGQADLIIQQLLFKQTITAIDATLEGHDVEVVTAFGKLNFPTVYLSATGTFTEGFALTLKDGQQNTTVDLMAKYLNGQIALSGAIKESSNVAKQLSNVLPVIAKKQGEKWIVDWHYKR